MTVSGDCTPAGSTSTGHDRDDEDDDELVGRARHDANAFALLYRRYVDPVYRYADRRLGNREAAEDATSLVFTKALAALPGYRTGIGTFRSWLFAIAHNVIVDAERAGPPGMPLEFANDLADPGSAEEAVLVAETQRGVRDLLNQLPVDQRAIVELRLAGHTGPEIAAILGRSLASVKFAQFRAYGRLRELLGVPAQSGEVRRDGG
jgi:RNA polymerase sigma factor (sigma-70 family)